MEIFQVAAKYDGFADDEKFEFLHYFFGRKDFAVGRRVILLGFVKAAGGKPANVEF